MTDGKMRHIALQIAACLVGLLSLASCAKTGFPTPGPDGEWVPLEDFTLTYRTTTPVVITKAAQSIAIENTVNNLYVLLFDSEGKTICSRQYLVTADETSDYYQDVINVFSVKQDENGTASQGVIPRFFNSFSGSLASGDYTFCAVANYSDDLAAKLTDVLHLDNSTYPDKSLKNVIDDSSAGGVVERNFFLMTAETKVEFATNITSDGTSYKVQDVVLDLKRVDAKITFNIEADIQDAADLSFTNVNYKVHNVPSLTYLFGKDKGTATTNDWDAVYTGTPDDNFDCMLNDNYQLLDVANARGGSFTFYMRENRPVVDNPIKEADNSNSSYSSLYAMREAWEYNDTGDPNSAGADVHGRSFKYAPAKATFVEINGILSYNRPDPNDASKKQSVYANVTYIVHLGETSSDPSLPIDADNETLVNNYDVRRNVHYTYNIRITGIESYIAEVNVDNPEEKRPGAEGDVYISTDSQIELDAHYSRYLIKINPATLASIAGWKVETPFGEASYTPEVPSDQTSDAGKIVGTCMDYKWALFAINKHFGEDGTNKMVKFPGVQAYDGGLDFFNADGSAVTLDKTAFSNDTGNSFEGSKKFKDIITSDNYYYEKTLAPDACLRDVHQLVRFLAQEYAKFQAYEAGTSTEGSDLIDENTTEIAITVFVDDYSYIYNPGKENYIHPGTPMSQITSTVIDRDTRLGLWKTYANAPNRVMSITPMATTSVSPDGNTSLTNSYITFSQKSIKSIYNTASSSVTSGWGMESVNETGRMSKNIQDPSVLAGSHTNTYNDGRTNNFNFYLDDSDSPLYNWTYMMNVNENVTQDNLQALNEAARNPFYACITRNRDLNGDDKIDKNEIIWYLAARDQITGIWVAQPALDEEAWLMHTGEYESTGARHYITSSIFDNSNTTTDLHKNMYVIWAEEGSSLGSSKDDESIVDNKYDYRCVRNLGIDLEATDAPAAYASISGPTQSTDPLLNGRNYYTVNLDGVNVRALRSDSDAVGLPYDTERSINNRPYESFDVIADNEPGPSGYRQVALSTLYSELNSNVNQCPAGWRIPNQREMVLLMSFIGGTNNFSLVDDANPAAQVAVASSFSYAGVGRYGANRNIFFYNNNNGNYRLQLHDENTRSVQIRCVRDHTN